MRNFNPRTSNLQAVTGISRTPASVPPVACKCPGQMCSTRCSSRRCRTTPRRWS